MTPKASESGFFSTLGTEDTEDDVPRRRKTTPEPDQPTDPESPSPSQARARQKVAQAEAAATRALTAPPRRRREPVHKVSVDVALSLVDGLQELYDRDRRGPKAEINEAIRNHLAAKNIHVEPWEG